MLTAARSNDQLAIATRTEVAADAEGADPPAQRVDTNEILARAEAACAQLSAASQPVPFTAVATRAGISRASLYCDAALRAPIDGVSAASRARGLAPWRGRRPR